MNSHQEDVMAFIIPEELIIPPPENRFKTPYYIKHVKFRGMEMVEPLSYERLQNNLLTEYLISTDHTGPQVIDRLMTVSFKQAYKDQPDCSQEVLKRGVVLSGAMFRFLGHSNSQLKDKTCYLMRATVEEIHDLLAEFAAFSKIPSTAKRARRIGLLFSSFNKSLSLHEDEYEIIQDIKRHQNNFTDGCGFMSEDFAKEIQRVHRLNHVPSAVQIRYQGYKGVLVVRPAELTGLKVQFRESMKKFRIPDDEVRRNCSTFGVVEYSKPYSKAFLNTQLTMVLADNGTLHDYLLELQRNYFSMLTNLCDNEEEALRYLTITGRKKTIRSLKEKGFENPQVQQDLRGLRNEDIKKMLKDDETAIDNVTNQKKISRLRVLVPKARMVFGVCDPYGELEYGEVFFQPTLPDGEEADEFSNARRVIVGRNPCYHPGDIRVLKLVHDKQRYNHLYDCIVFPTKGRRPHPDECSGGDLDGDKFFVSWDEFLFPKWITKAFPYREEEKEEEDPYCSVGKTLRDIFLPLSNIFGSFGRAHFQRIFGTEDEEIRQKNVRQRAELLNFFANFNNKLVSRINAIFMKYASRHGPSCETCVTLNKYFRDAIDMVANSGAIEKQLEQMEHDYRKEETAHDDKNSKAEPVYPRLIYPSRRIVRRRVEMQKGFLNQLKIDCRSSKKESIKEGDECVWTTMEQLSELFVRKNVREMSESSRR